MGEVRDHLATVRAALRRIPYPGAHVDELTALAAVEEHLARLERARDDARALLQEWHVRHVLSLDKAILSNYPESLEWRTYALLSAGEEGDRSFVARLGDELERLAGEEGEAE